MNPAKNVAKTKTTLVPITLMAETDEFEDVTFLLELKQFDEK
jgi:hypothetical protein